MLMFFLLLFLNSCYRQVPNLIRLANTDKPQNETEIKINAYLNENNIHYDYSILANDTCLGLLSTKELAINKYKLQNGTNASPIQFRVYDSAKNFVTAYSQCFGSYNFFKPLKNYPPDKIDFLVKDIDIDLNNEFKVWDIDSLSLNKMIKDISNSELTIIVYWNIWSNYFSKVMLKDISKYKEKHGDKLCVILINSGKDPN